MYNALKDGRLKGAGLDVWYDYPSGGDPEVVYPSRFPFHELSNVVLSPHVGGLTHHAVGLNIEHTIDNIRSYLKTGRPRFEIDPGLMY